MRFARLARGWTGNRPPRFLPSPIGALRGLAALSACVLLVVCGELPTVTTTSGQAHLNLVPLFSSQPAAQQSGASVNNVRVRLTRPNGTLLKDTVVVFAPGEDSVTVKLVVTVVPNEQLDAALDFRDGEVILFAGHAAVTAYVTPPTGGVPPVVIPVDYVGPGKNAVKLTVSPASGSFSTTANVLFSAQVFDANNTVVTGVPIGWAVDDATLGSIDVAGSLHPSGKRGTITVTANTPTGLKGTASVLLLPPARHLVVISGANQTAEIRKALANPLVVEARDQNGSPVPGHAISFASSGATFSPASVLTDANGRAQTVITLGRRSGAQQVLVLGADTAVVTEVAVPAPASRLRFDVSPSTTEVTAPIAPAVVVAVTDSADNVVTSATNAISVALSGGPTGAHLGGTTTVSAAQGFASFATLTVDSIGTGYSLGASATGLIAASSAGFNVVALRPVRVTIAPRTVTLTAFGATSPLAATVLDSRGNAIPDAVVTWASRQPTLASVNAGGTVLAVANGTATIVATSGSATDSIPVVVSQVVDTVMMSRDSIVLSAAGDTATIRASAFDANHNAVTNQSATWSTSDATVASVTPAGLVTLQGAGIATITATVGGKKGNTIVRSAPNGVPVRVGFISLAVSPASASMRVGDTTAFTVVRLMSDGTTRPSNAIWASDAPGRATVDGTGRVIAYDTTSATITATDSGIAGHAHVSVLPAPVIGTIAFAPTTVTGVSTSAQSTVVTASLRDYGSGITSMQAVFTAPGGGTTRSCTITSPYTGDRKAGGWRCTVSLPVGSTTGAWHLTSVTLVGTITRVFNETALSAFGTTTLTVNP